MVRSDNTKEQVIILYKDRRNIQSQIRMAYKDWLDLKRIAKSEKTSLNSVIRKVDEARTSDISIEKALGVFYAAYCYAYIDEYYRSTR